VLATTIDPPEDEPLEDVLAPAVLAEVELAPEVALPPPEPPDEELPPHPAAARATAAETAATLIPRPILLGPIAILLGCQPAGSRRLRTSGRQGCFGPKHKLRRADVKR
jgi:hypothetical protein